MKTLLTASALLLASNVALSASFEDQFQNVDLGTGVHDRPVTMIEPMGSADFTVSLDTFNQGNPDYSAHAEGKSVRPRSSQGFVSTLDHWGEGNPDHV